MTLLQISQFVCSKLKQLDAVSLTDCQTFVKARYRMVADAYPWKDIEISEAVNLPVNANVIGLPSTMGDVISIRAGTDNYLDPVTRSLLLQTDPTIFERSGPPTVYLEHYDDLAEAQGPGRKITVYPKPTEITSLLIIGKRKLAELGPNDEPIIRNIDNVLIAFANGDMLERRWKAGAGKLKFDEAGELLKLARSIEENQVNKPRVSKQLTVAGNSLSELVDAVCARTGQWGLDSVVLTKEFLRRGYQRVYDACNWSEATVIARVNTDGSEVVLPVYFDRVIAIRANASLGQLQAVEPGLYFGVAPSIFEQTGEAVSFSYLTPCGVAILPPLYEQLSLSSSSTLDKSVVHIMGESHGSELSEDVTLNGTVPVQTVFSYDTPLTVAKGVTKGDVQVFGVISGIGLERILAGERERKHMRLWLQPTPPASVVLVLGKRRIKPLLTSEDTPILRDIQDILINQAAGDMFSKMGDAKQSETHRKQAAQALQIMVDLEIGQGAYNARIVPMVEPDPYQMAAGGCW